MLQVSSRIIHQNLIHTDNDGKLVVILTNMSSLNKDHGDLRTIVERNEGRALGLSGTFMSDGTLRVLSIADAATVILIDLSGDKNNERGRNSSDTSLTTPGRDYLCDHVLGRTCGFLYAFDMGPLALALWQDHDLRIKQAIDLQCAGPATTRAPHATIKLATADMFKLIDDNIIRTFNNFTCEHFRDLDTPATVTPLVQRAWVAHFVSQLSTMEERLFQVLPIDTTKFTDALLKFLAKSTVDSIQRDQIKQTQVTRTYNTSFDAKKRKLNARANRYRDMIRKGRNQSVYIHASNPTGGGAFNVPAEIVGASAQTAHLETDGFLAGKKVAAITLIGRKDPTLAEVKRSQVILAFLQGKFGDGDDEYGPWIQKIYLNLGEDFMWPAEWSQPTPSSVKLNPDKIPCPLNSSQRKAVRCMLDQTDSPRATIIQGPPGTGKTTVIASYVLTATSAGKSGIWLIAQSNIAVKNIAEKLANFGLTNWRLLVSDDFYDVWHEHLYTTIKTNTITSGEFHERTTELHGCPVMLCTLSMLSSDALRKQGAFRMNPVHTVVIDEASQIEIGDYIPLFSNFSTIRKVIFIGDNMQLPPHGQDDIPSLQSVFEQEHLLKQNPTSSKNPFIFLDIQYRMPPQIGDFIAQTVYCSEGPEAESFLKSSESHSLAEIEESSLLCYFVDVVGQQIQTEDKSWKNLEECKAIIQLAFLFQAQGKNYRVITPYEAQRSLIEKEMREAELEWGDKCFNVDSFQGNEEDYIIISIVRSRDLGFLADRRRVNVMLSRCKRGMIIFTSKAYIEKYAGPGKSLIGELISSYYDNEAWIEVGDLATTNFL